MKSILKITSIYKCFTKKIVKNRIELKINQIIFKLNGEFYIVKRKMPDINLKILKSVILIYDLVK